MKVTAEDGDATENYTVTVTRRSYIALVRNDHITAQRGQTQAGTTQNGYLGQRFTTGPNTTGYTLSAVGVFLNKADLSGDETMTVRVHRFDDSATNDLGTLVATLTTPTLTAGEVNYFAAPAGTALAHDTQYIVNFHNEANVNSDLEIGTVLGDGQIGYPGWTIEDASRTAGSLSAFDSSLVIVIRGLANASSDDATLSDLKLLQGSTTIALNRPFAPATSSYTATVKNDVAEITVSPTPSDDGASIEYQDDSYSAITDNDTGAEGHQVALDLGANVIRLKITAEDGHTTEVYNIRVTRVTTSMTLVKNTHLTSFETALFGDVANGSAGQRFSTGDHDLGYTLTSVGICVHEDDFPAPKPSRRASTSLRRPPPSTWARWSPP